MSEAKTETRESPPVVKTKMVYSVAPDLIAESLRKLREKLVSKHESELSKKINEIMAEADNIAHELSKLNMELGSMIISPESAEEAYRTMFLSVIMAAEIVMRDVISDVMKKFDQAIESRDIEKIAIASKSIKDFFRTLLVIHISIIVIQRKLGVLLALNAPANLRPPLVNMLIPGYDLVPGE